MLKQFTTSVFIINTFESNLKIALIHHKKFDRWMVPGGHIEPCENQVEAAIREAREETGLSIKLFSFLHAENKVNDSEWVLAPEYFYQQQIPASTLEESHYHLDFAYLAFANEVEFTFNSNETKDIKWVDLEEALNFNLFDGTRFIIHQIISKFENKEKLQYLQDA
ncbi:NUDIX domain-containing protein [Flavobacterium sp. ZT3R18]|uniref:NUDIX hydrolase n=1 Tax=Flavobacterium sp. ZT3R18 TaxID=2594429 RepID=UPI00117A5A0D|nr:NUDIX domain-containing protein [Flavobacterium sp. ZT3R18]TRX37816.1 NUDIX domain-containing protein [Flavobacterium sp. ZT3R18]